MGRGYPQRLIGFVDEAVVAVLGANDIVFADVGAARRLDDARGRYKVRRSRSVGVVVSAMMANHPAPGGTGLARFVFWAMLTIVALSPLPFGGNRPASWSVLSLLVGVLLVLWSVAAWRDPAIVGVPSTRHWPFSALFLALVAWFLVQMSTATPPSWHHPLWRDAADALGLPLAGSISVSRGDTATALMRLVAYGAIFWLAMHYGASRTHARAALWSVALAGAAYASYGLVVDLGGLDKILWYDKWAYNRSLTSTFVNRNSYATYAGITLIVCLALLIPIFRLSSREGLNSAQGIAHFLGTFPPHGWLLVVFTLAIGTAILLTHSRAGFIATIVGVAAFLAISTVARGAHRSAVKLLAILAPAGIAVLLLISGEVTLKRIDEGAIESLEGRLALYAGVVAAIEDTPWQGTGLGTFPSIFRLHRDASIIGPFDIDKAHNTYLELALEAELPAFAAMMALFAAVVLILLRGVWQRRRDVIYPATGVAVTVLVGVHALVDFSIQIPAVAAVYFLLLGIAFAQSWRTRED